MLDNNLRGAALNVACTRDIFFTARDVAMSRALRSGACGKIHCLPTSYISRSLLRAAPLSQLDFEIIFSPLIGPRFLRLLSCCPCYVLSTELLGLAHRPEKLRSCGCCRLWCQALLTTLSCATSRQGRTSERAAASSDNEYQSVHAFGFFFTATSSCCTTCDLFFSTVHPLSVRGSKSRAAVMRDSTVDLASEKLSLFNVVCSLGASAGGTKTLRSASWPTASSLATVMPSETSGLSSYPRQARPQRATSILSTFGLFVLLEVIRYSWTVYLERRICHIAGTLLSYQPFRSIFSVAHSVDRTNRCHSADPTLLLFASPPLPHCIKFCCWPLPE